MGRGVDVGEEILVVGRVRRRFYRNPVSGTASRTDVEAGVIARRPDAGAERRSDAASTRCSNRSTESCQPPAASQTLMADR
ncbi:MAG: hypothetical protein ACRDWD_01760 [Acidimicrobiia bacterium]